MGKNKLKKFAENETFRFLFQPPPVEMYRNDFFLKGKWNNEFFKNDHPIVLEVGCGKGEYTTGLAEHNPDKNFIGIDIKGPRLWRGCKTVSEKGLKNVAFIRNKVEFLTSFFEKGEISEIWVTFPDPQPKKDKKKLTSARFLELYAQISKPGALVHLKTDSLIMFEFTKEIIKINNLKEHFSTHDLYNENIENDTTRIQTYYEQSFLKHGMNITYIKFELTGLKTFTNP